MTRTLSAFLTVDTEVTHSILDGIGVTEFEPDFDSLLCGLVFLAEDPIEIASSVDDANDDDTVCERLVIDDIRRKISRWGSSEVLDIACCRFRTRSPRPGMDASCRKVASAAQEPQRSTRIVLPDVLRLRIQVKKGKVASDDAAAHPLPRSSGLRVRIRSRSAVQSSDVISLVGLCSPASSFASSSWRSVRRWASRISSRRYSLPCYSHPC